MPYIKENRRVDILLDDLPTNAGELNFAITMIAKIYLQNNGEKYQTYNDIIGALECAKMEMYRRKVAPYEDYKIEENGDIFYDDKPLPKTRKTITEV